jgi:hypothetical protein
MTSMNKSNRRKTMAEELIKFAKPIILLLKHWNLFHGNLQKCIRKRPFLNVRLRFFENKKSYVGKAKVVPCKKFYLVDLFIWLGLDTIDAETVLIHELAHILSAWKICLKQEVFKIERHGKDFLKAYLTLIRLIELQYGKKRSGLMRADLFIYRRIPD